MGIMQLDRGQTGHKGAGSVEIGQVEAFLAVGTFGGFRRAADALRVTQPAVSARIKALEDSLGVSLFERGKTGMALSAAGRALRPHAEQLLRAVALARQAVHDLGLARSLHHPEVETVSLRDDPLMLVAAPGSAMARAGKARLEEVAAQPLVL